MATRREAAATTDREIKRTFVELAPPKGFADPPQKRGRKGVNPVTDTGASITDGAFYTKYVDGAGDTYLQGGSVFGGNGGTSTIGDYKVKDSATGVVHTAGTKLYLQASCEATVSDGIMLPGCKLNTADLDTTAGSVPNNHTFTVASDTGNLYVEIGRWTADDFLPAAPGNIMASGCIGNFYLSRA